MNTFNQKRNTRMKLKEFNGSFMEGLWGYKPWSKVKYLINYSKLANTYNFRRFTL